MIFMLSSKIQYTKVATPSWHGQISMVILWKAIKAQRYSIFQQISITNEIIGWIDQWHLRRTYELGMKVLHETHVCGKFLGECLLI